MRFKRDIGIDKEESLEYIFSLCSDEPYERHSEKIGTYDEVLVISEDAVDFTRLNSGSCAFLKDHDPENVLGVITKAWIDGNKVKASVKFSEREEVQGYVKDIQAGIMTCTSIGYDVVKHHFENVNGKKTMYVDRFVIYEGSLVGVPADITCGFNRAAETINDEEEDMNKKDEIINETNTEEVLEEKKGACPECGNDPCTCEESQSVEVTSQEKEDEIVEEVTEEKEEAEVTEEYDDAEEIKSLGEITDTAELAETFIAEKKSYKEFKNAIRSHKNLKNKLNIKEKKEMNKFSVRKALLNTIGKLNDNEAAFERGVIEENKRKYHINDADIVITPNDLNLRAFNGQESLNQVTYMPGMYTGVQRPPVTIDALGLTKVAVTGPSISFSVATSGVNGGYVDINGSIPSATMDFTLKTLTPKKAGAYVDVSYQSLLQDDPSAEGIIVDDIAKAIDQVRNDAFWNGLAANNQPVGLLNATDVNEIEIPETPTLSTALAFEKAIRASYDYSTNLKWVFGTEAYYEWASTPKSSTAVNEFLIDDNRNCIGYECFVDPSLPTSAIVLGNFNEALEANFDGIAIKVVEDATLARKQAIEVVAYNANDFLFRRPKSFSRSK